MKQRCCALVDEGDTLCITLDFGHTERMIDEKLCTGASVNTYRTSEKNFAQEFKKLNIKKIKLKKARRRFAKS